MTAIVDLFPHHLRRGYRKELFTAFVCAVWFLIGLSMVTKVMHFSLQKYGQSGMIEGFCDRLQ